MDRLSEILWTDVCRLVGPEEEVYVRRRNIMFYDQFQRRLRITNFMHFASGSRAEGLCLPGSDEDTIEVKTDISVLPWPSSFVSFREPDLILETGNVKPGYSRLRVTSNSQVRKEWIVSRPKYGKSPYLSSLLFRNFYLRLYQGLIPDASPHGPCASQGTVLETDTAWCFSCKEWPDVASEWKHRRRLNNWPSGDLTQNIINDGCLVVPIGSRLSADADVEWRISFNFAEKKLVYAMTHTQFLCYGLLKLYLKHVIESDKDMKDLLCSYFLKTALFHCVEEDNIIWDKQNFIHCFWACFLRIFAWVRQGFCPNYFVKDSNMFEGKVYGDKQVRLIQHMATLYTDGIATFFAIPYLGNLKAYIRGALTNPSAVDIKITELEFYCDKFLFSIVAVMFPCEVFQMDLLSKLKSVPVNCALETTIKKKEVCLVRSLFSQLIYRDCEKLQMSNKEMYQLFTMLKSYIHRTCANLFTVSGCLLYATLSYKTGQYVNAIGIVKHVLQQFQPYTIYSSMSDIICDKDAYVTEICGRSLTAFQKMKKAVAYSYICFPTCCMYPQEVESEIRRHTHLYVTYIPPVVYSYVLLFLSYKALGCIEQKLFTLNCLHIFAHDRRFLNQLEKPLARALFKKCVEIDGNKLSRYVLDRD